MRYINLDQLELPDSWQVRADAAIADEPGKIKDHSDVWRDLKRPLMKLSHDKCYYCEIVQERSDGAVDHFRPKSKYPWSAFSPSNYRFACTFCNSVRSDKESEKTGGKEKIFPSMMRRSGQLAVQMRQMRAQSFWTRASQTSPAL